MNFLLGWPIFRCYVSFREGNLLVSELQSSRSNPDIFFPPACWARKEHTGYVILDIFSISVAETPLSRFGGRIHNQGKYADQRYVLGA